MLTLIKAPRRYANLGELMQYANDLAIDNDTIPTKLPHAANDMTAAWKSWVTEEVMEFVTDGHTHIIEPGFITDFASIPRVFRWLFDPSGAPHQVAAVAHDYLYSSAPVTRATADRVYLDICSDLGVPHWKARLMYDALRVGGWAAWRSNRKKLVELGNRWRYLA